MLEIVLSNRFKKDLKLAAKRGYNLERLNDVVNLLAAQEKLPEKYKDHELIGNYVDNLYNINNEKAKNVFSKTKTITF